MSLPPVVSPAEWHAARERLLVKEKEQTRARDALAAERRQLPMVPFRGDYVFAGPDGPATLLDLFDGRRQLIVYHFMLAPSGEPCTGCSFFVDNIAHLAHLHARDTSLVLVSPAPAHEIAAVRARMGWTIPWFSSGATSFDADAGVAPGSFGLNVFLRDGDDVYRTYFTTSRGVEALGTVWSLLDVTPLGRQETWEDSPAGRPQTPPYQWWRLHYDYDARPVA